MSNFVDDLARELVRLGVLDQVNGWLARGDGIAVYENMELGSGSFGARQYVSFGSEQAQIETNDPPQRLPDIGGAINWRYQLVGTWQGRPLAVPDE